jgi:hypothetical protein
MFCAQCGTENPDDARFCGNCGAASEAPDPTPVVSPGSPVAQVLDLGTPAEAVPPGLKWGVLGVSVLIPIVGVGMGLYYWIRGIKGGSEEKAAVGRLWFFVAIGLVILYSLIAGESY